MQSTNPNKQTPPIPETSVRKPGPSPINPSLSRGNLLQKQIRLIIWETRNHLLLHKRGTAHAEVRHVSLRSLTQELQRGREHDLDWQEKPVLCLEDVQLFSFLFFSFFYIAKRYCMGWCFSSTRASVHWELNWQGWNSWVCLFYRFKAQRARHLKARVHHCMVSKTAKAQIWNLHTWTKIGRNWNQLKFLGTT